MSSTYRARPAAGELRLAAVPHRDGFSLLEIVLALAILAGALAALGEVMRLGDQNAALARDESQAEMLADSVMSELACGVRQLSAVNNAAFDLAVEPPWVYSIAVDATEYQELVAVRVSVAQQLAPEMQPARCELVRWMLNPDFVNSELAAQEAAAEEASQRESASSSSNRGNQGSNSQQSQNNNNDDDDDNGGFQGGRGGGP